MDSALLPTAPAACAVNLAEFWPNLCQPSAPCYQICAKLFFQLGAQVDRALAKAEKAVREEAFAPPPRDAGAEATGILRSAQQRSAAGDGEEGPVKLGRLTIFLKF